MLVAMSVMLFGCGGGGGGAAAPEKSVKKAAVSGTVSFPALGSLVAKRVGSTAPTTPVLTITDLSGASVATVTLNGVVNGVNKSFTYSTSLDISKDYVIRASWGGQVLRSLADRSTLSTLTTEINVSAVSTAAVLVTEKKLNLTSGQLGTTAAGSITTENLGAVNPAAILAAVTGGTDTAYTALVTAVTSVLEANTFDPSTVSTVTTAANSAASVYTAPAKLTLAMISGKSFKNYSGSAITFHSDGTATTSKNANVNYWALNLDGTVLLSYHDSSTNTSGWDKFTLIQNNSPASLVISDLNINGTTYADETWTYYTPFTTAMISGKTFNFSGNTKTGNVTFNKNGTHTYPGGTGTWSINASGQLVAIDDETSTMTITANTGTVITATVVGSTSGTYTATLTAVTAGTSIIGTWGVYGDPAVSTGIITFVDSTHYMFVQAGPGDAYGTTGLEYGTYTYSPATGTGVFDKSPIFDTNGEWGMSHPPAGTSYTISVAGDTLTIGNTVEGTHQAPRMQNSATNPVIGSWWAPSTDLASGKPGGVLMVFLDSTHCLLAQAGNDSGDYSTGGMNGVELGTYSISASNIMTLSLVVDTNGDWGFWSLNPVHGTYPISVSGDVLNIGGNIVNRLTEATATNSGAVTAQW